MKASSLCSQFPVLKMYMVVKENLKANNLPKITAFLNRESVGYRWQMSKVLTVDQITKFIIEAPDESGGY